jgi:hypothetical protein
MNLFYARAINGEIVFENKKEIKDYLLTIENKPLSVRIDRQTGIRTADQNRALHKYFTLLSEALNDAGLTVQHVLKEKIELNWTPSMIKELLWREVQIRLFGKQSTKDLDKVSEINEVHEHLTRHLGEIFQLEAIPFPHDPQKIK